MCKEPRNLIGDTPFHWAALSGNQEICQSLLENRINQNSKNFRGRIPLHAAALTGHEQLIKVLIKGQEPLNSYLDGEAIQKI